MGLIYVNPEGPNGNPDPLAAARDIRETFRRMAMNDEETVALIAGGHTFGKTHGAADPDEYVGPEPEGAPLEEQGLGWKNTFGTGKGADAITSGLEVTWTTTPTTWGNSFFENLFGYEWELTKSPAGAHQWQPKDGAGAGTVPGRRRRRRATRPPTMLTTDLALRFDPVYEQISRRFHENPDEFADAFARAWFKLTHRDMGPIERYLGPEVPPETLIWQDPVPAVDARARSAPRTSPRSRRRSSPRACRSPSWSPPRGRRPRRSAAATSAAAPTARASASSRRAAGRSTTPTQLATVLRTLEGIQEAFNAPDGKQVSLADLIVLAGCRGRRAGRQERRHRRRGPVHAGPHGRVAGADRRRVVRRARADRRRVPQLPAARATGCRPSTCCSTGRTC